MRDSPTMTTFEDLSDEIIISIIEYLTMEEFTSIFGQLNTRLACIIFDHPWTMHRLNVQKMDSATLDAKLDFIEEMKLIPRISSINISPVGIYRSITLLHERKPMEHFENLKSLSLNNIILTEAESIFTPECLSKLQNLSRLRLVFSFGMEQQDYAARVERLIGQILIHPPLQHFGLHTARAIDFSDIPSPSALESLEVNYCSFQSLHTLFEFTPHLRHLTATIAILGELNLEQPSTFPPLTYFQLTLSVPAFERLTTFVEKCPKLQKLHIITHSVIEPLSVTAAWHKLVTEHLPVLTKFKREASVALESIAEYVELFHWPNGWKSKEKSAPQGSNYSRITVINVRY